LNPEWWAIIVSGLLSLGALTQSFWIKGLTAAFTPRKIKIFEAILPDVNFGPVGCWIGLCGSLISRNLEALVTSMHAVVIRNSDGSEYTFKALFNRARTLTVAGDTINVAAWNVLHLPVDEPVAYDAMFCDEVARRAFKAIGEVTRPAWLQRVAKTVPPPYDDSIPDNAKRLATANQVLYKDPQSAAFINGVASQLLAHFYWLAGDYSIRLRVSLDATNDVFEKTWRITITPEMEQNLRENTGRMIATACMQPPVIVGQFFTAWPEYEPVSAQTS
jgi:hypothetical protein